MADNGKIVTDERYQFLKATYFIIKNVMEIEQLNARLLIRYTRASNRGYIQKKFACATPKVQALIANTPVVPDESFRS